jgi:phospholipase A2
MSTTSCSMLTKPEFSSSVDKASKLDAGCPHVPNGVAAPSIQDSPRIHLIDGGMDNNCPTYVLLHPSRKVDVILNVDASSDVHQNTFQARVDQIGSRRRMKFVKRAKCTEPGDDTKSRPSEDMYAQIYDGTILEQRPATVVDSYGQSVTNPPAPACETDCTMVYMPLLPNEQEVKGFDPSTAKFSGSFNLVWTTEQVETLVRVSAANFRAGEKAIKTVLRETWLKKKKKRETLEI